MQLHCYEECTYDRGSNSDEPYILVGIVTDDGTVNVTRSDVFGDVDSGEKRPSNGMADEILWEGRIKGESGFAIVLMERDESSWSTVMQAFEDMMRDAYTEFSIGSGTGVDRAALWNTALTFSVTYFIDAICGNRWDDRIGAVQSFVFTEHDVQEWWDEPSNYGDGHLYSARFQGGGGTYGVILKFGL